MKLYVFFLNFFLRIGQWFVFMSTHIPFAFSCKKKRPRRPTYVKKSIPFNHQLLPIFDDHKKDLCKQIS